MYFMLKLSHYFLKIHGAIKFLALCWFRVSLFCFMTWLFWRVLTCCRMSHILDLSTCFPIFRFRLSFFGRKMVEVLPLPSYQEAHEIWLFCSWLLWSGIIWLSGIRCSFPCTSTFVSLWLVGLLWDHAWDHVNILFLYNFLPSAFSIYRSFLSESITLKIAKWLFSNSVFSFSSNNWHSIRRTSLTVLLSINMCLWIFKIKCL